MPVHTHTREFGCQCFHRSSVSQVCGLANVTLV